MFFKEKLPFIIAAPITGIAKPLSQVNDPVFSDKVLGDGIAIEPLSDCVKAPFDGEVVQIAHTLHALVVRSEGGIEFLIHMGIDTVHIDEPVFRYLVEPGGKVTQGQELVQINWDVVKNYKYSTDTPCVILNGGIIKKMKCFYGEVKAGETKIIECNL